MPLTGETHIPQGAHGEPKPARGDRYLHFADARSTGETGSSRRMGGMCGVFLSCLLAASVVFSVALLPSGAAMTGAPAVVEAREVATVFTGRIGVARPAGLASI